MNLTGTKKRKECFISTILLISIIFSSVYYLNYNSKADESTKNENNFNTISRDTSISVDENGVLNISRNEHKDEKTMGKDDTWTLFIYMTGSNLETEYECASADIQEMLDANFTKENLDNVNVIIQTGGSKDWHSNKICDDRIERHKVDTNSVQLTNLARLKNTSMGDPNTLYDFLDWGIENYPAEHMGIVFWNHGSGVSRGLCFDENYNDDSLSVHELEYTLAKINKKMTSKFELLGFDTCLSGSLEYANLLAPYAKYMIASADVAIAKGWYYTEVINYLLEHPDATGAELGPIVCDATTNFLIDFYKINPVDYTFATYDLSKVDEVCIEANYLGKYLYETLKTNPNLYKQISNFNNSRLTYEYDCVDIGSLLYYFENNNDLNYDTTHFRNALDKFILHCNFKNKFDSEKSGIGVTLHMPIDNITLQQLDTYRNVCFSPYLLKYIEYMNSRFINEDMSTYIEIPWENSPYFFEENFEFINYDTDYSDDVSSIINETTKENLLKRIEYKEDGFVDAWFNNIYVRKNTTPKNAISRNEASNKKCFFLPDGQLLTAYILKENQSTTLYSFPVLLDDKVSSIRVEGIKNDDDTITYITLGVWDCSDSPYCDDKIARGYLPLKDNTSLIPLYDVYDSKTNTYITKKGNPYIINNNFAFIEQP